jgi:hypothetical protein
MVVVHEYTIQSKSVQSSKPRGISCGHSEPPSGKALAFAQGWTIVHLTVPRYGANISHWRVGFGAVIGKP